MPSAVTIDVRPGALAHRGGARDVVERSFPEHAGTVLACRVRGRVPRRGRVAGGAAASIDA